MCYNTYEYSQPSQGSDMTSVLQRFRSCLPIVNFHKLRSLGSWRSVGQLTSCRACFISTSPHPSPGSPAKFQPSCACKVLAKPQLLASGPSRAAVVMSRSCCPSQQDSEFRFVNSFCIFLLFHMILKHDISSNVVDTSTCFWDKAPQRSHSAGVVQLYKAAAARMASVKVGRGQSGQQVHFPMHGPVPWSTETST